MKKFGLYIVALAIAILSSGPLYAQDVSGDWQGILKGTAPIPDL